VITARIGDPVAHRRAVGPLGARRLDARIAQAPGDGPWRGLADLAAEPDASIDTLVSVGAFCADRSVDAAVAAARRVLAPGGRLVFLEHVGRPGGFGLLQRLSDPLWSSLPTGCHVDHDLVAALRRGGFVVVDLERCTVPSVVPILRPWVQGVAMLNEVER
jgi:SAM-dependent methyltransferase